MDNNSTSIRRPLILAIVLILVCVIGFHIFLLFSGITIGIIGGAAWGIIVATISLFAIAGILFFVIPGILILLLSLFALGWVILSVVLFPILFPLVAPIFIILLFIAYASRRRRS
jgi:hypothetical protein